MASKFRFLLASALLCSSMTTAGAQTSTGTFGLRLSVPVHCVVSFEGQGAGLADGAGGFSLGQLQEYCNAPRGYELVVSYTPGTLRGARLNAGGDQVVLDGSGEEVISRVTGPRIQARQLAAAPGENGFDTDHLVFQIRPV
jgi:hypothetical protein